MNPDTKYQKALDYLYSHIDFSLTRNLRYSEEKFNLDRMIRLMEKIGNPQSDYPVIHVAGTKGKGSVCAMMTSILTHAGYQTGFYSSPHMIDFNERIRIGNNLIKNSAVSRYLNYLKKPAEKIKNISTFELITAMAFKYFSDQRVDVAVIEVGMGGRLDATNIVQPIISIITKISLDHTKILGNTIPKIAKEKSGIIKKNVPVVVAPQIPDAKKTIMQTANEKGARVIDVQKEIEYEVLSFNLYGQRFIIRITNNGEEFGPFFMPLLGDHQVVNAAVAYASVTELKKLKWKVHENAVSDGFAEIEWPGRFEVLNKNPLIIIDGAHNEESFRQLKKTIIKYLPGKKIVFIFGVSEDKKVKSMLSIINPIVDKLILTNSDHPRAISSKELAKIANGIGIDNIAFSTIEEALNYAVNQINQNSAILASGSIFIAGAVKQIYEDNLRNARKFILFT